LNVSIFKPFFTKQIIMLLRSLTLASSLALTAYGLLIPPSISSAIGHESENLLLSMGYPDSPTKRLVRLDCPGCVYASYGEDGHVQMQENVANYLMMTLDIRPSDSIDPEDALYVNGLQLYPLSLSPLHREFTAVQVASDGQNKDIQLGRSVPVSFQTIIRPVSNALVGGDEVMSLEMTIKAVNGKSVDGVPVLKAMFFRTGGKLMIAKVETIRQEKSDTGKECTSIFPVLCKWRAIILHRIHKAKSAFRGCHRRVGLHFSKMAHHRLPKYRGHHHGGHHNIQKIDPFAIAPHLVNPHKSSNTNSKHISETENNNQPHHRTHHYYLPPHPQVHQHSIIHTIRRVFIHVLVPVFIGTAAGMTTGLLGLVIGQLVVGLWRRFFRRGGNRGAGGVVHLPDEEKERFLDGDEKESLPEYKDVSTMTSMGMGVHVVERE
jgi:hypothetical protein